MTDSTTFATRCRRYATMLRNLAKTAKRSESREPLRKFADEFDQMAKHATESDHKRPRD
jgi:hypothetical protein